MHKTMVVYGVDRRLDRRVKCHWTHSTLTFVCVCILHHRFTPWFHSILAVSVGGLLFIVHTACYPLSRRVTGTWAFHWTPEKKSTKGSTFRQEVNFTSATLKIDDVGLRFTGSKKQVALRDSLHLSKIWRMEWHCSWLPDSSFVLVWVALSQMSAGELVLCRVLYKSLRKKRPWQNDVMHFCLFVTHKTCKNSQIIHLRPPTQTFSQVSCGPSNTPIIHPWPQSCQHFSAPTSPPLFFQPPYCVKRDPSPALSLTPFVSSTPTYPPTCQGPASHVHHWVMDGVEGHHPTLKSSLIPSAMQTPPNHSGGRYWNYTFRENNLGQGCTALQNLLFERCVIDNKSYFWISLAIICISDAIC